MEIVTGSTGEAHVTPIDDAVRNTNTGFYEDRVVFDTLQKFEAAAITANEVRVYSGYGMNQGRIFKIEKSDYDSLTIENGAQGVKRADLICARYTMDSQTGYEDISLVVIKGQSGGTYVDPNYYTGNVNEGDDIDDFPLYRVKLNGIIIESVERLFVPLPDGGRLGQLESRFNAHLENNIDPHTITWSKSNTLTDMSLSDTLSVTFGKIAKAISELISHIANKNNPHEVSGSQLTGAVPVEKGGTGATTAAEALAALGVPSDVADAMSKNVYTDTSNDAIKPAKGGTGRSSWGAGKVLVGNGTAAATERSIDSTSGGIQNSDALTTSGALYATKSALQSSFQAGVNAVYNACVNNGVTPSASTPTAIANAISSIRSGGTANATQIINGYTAYAGKQLLTGNMPHNGSWATNVNPSGGGVTRTYIPKGYHSGNGYVDSYGSNSYNDGVGVGHRDARTDKALYYRITKNSSTGYTLEVYLADPATWYTAWRFIKTENFTLNNVGSQNTLGSAISVSYDKHIMPA